MNTERIDQRFKALENKYPCDMSNGELTAYLDDVVMILAGAGVPEWTEATNSTAAGKQYLMILHEIRSRLK